MARCPQSQEVMFHGWWVLPSLPTTVPAALLLLFPPRVLWPVMSFVPHCLNSALACSDNGTVCHLSLTTLLDSSGLVPQAGVVSQKPEVTAFTSTCCASRHRNTRSISHPLPAAAVRSQIMPLLVPPHPTQAGSVTPV